jgi:uncharacterized protein
MGRHLAFVLLLLTGCSETLSASQQTCLECALRRRDSQEASAAMLRVAELCQNGDAASCSTLGVAYETGHGVPADARKAAALFQRACTGGNLPACVHLGEVFERGTLGRVDKDGAEIIYRAACDGHLGEGCHRLARLRYQAGAVGDAAKLLARGCKEGHARSCESLGVMYRTGQGVPRDEKRALGLFARACRGGAEGACAQM